mgnify:CR=1 FL=1
MRIILMALALFFGATVFGQNQPDYASIKLDTKENFTDEVNSTALKAATYILSTPIDKKSNPRLLASQFLLRWMTGSPHYSFEIGEQVGKITKGNDDLLIVYMAAMTKYCLENPASKDDQPNVKLASIKQLLNYCQTQQVSLTKELKKLHKANEEGELEKHLK